MKKRFYCFLLVFILLIQTAYAAGIGAFDQAGTYRYEDDLYYAEFDQSYNIDAHGSEPPFFSEGYAPVCINGLWGYVDIHGLVSIDLKYASAGQFSEGRAFVGTTSGMACIDTTGAELFLLECSRAFPYQNGLAKFEKNGKYGFVDIDGNVVIEPIWLDAGYASEGLIPVADENGYGYVNTTGAIFVTPQYEVAAEFSGGAAYVQADGVGRLINMEGVEICENVYSGLIEGLALIKGEEGWGFVDARGETVIDCVWEDADLPSESYIAVRKDGKWGFINFDGEQVIDCTWDYVWPFSNGLAMVATATDSDSIAQYGFINTLGEQVAAPVYEDAKPFSDGRAAVCQDGLWGYIDVLGSQIIPCTYAFAASFHENFAVVGATGVFSVLTTEGEPMTFYRAEEAPAEQEPVTPEDSGTGEVEITLTPLPNSSEQEEKTKTSIGSIIAIVIAVLFLSLLAAVVILREINIRRRRRRRLISRGGKRAK